MAEMTTHERMTRVFAHREPDRVPIIDSPWQSTLARWLKEGLPSLAGWREYFGLDYFALLNLDTSPRFELKVIEETETYRIEQDIWGVTKKNFKPISTTPYYLDFAIKDPATWAKAKQRMTPTLDRIDWRVLKENYKRWRREGAWIISAPWFGYDIVNARMCGTETILYAMVDNPAWVMDMFNTGCDLTLALLDMVWEAGYTIDELIWFDDMAYRKGLIFSKAMWHEMIRPYQKRVIDWAHAHGIVAHLHCCGNISSLIPELIALGLDKLSPLEVKAGMDAIEVKRQYGDQLVLQGGFDVRNWDDLQKVEADIRRVLPAVMEAGGYVFSSDHSIPHNVSLQNYKRIVELVKEVGRY